MSPDNEADAQQQEVTGYLPDGTPVHGNREVSVGDEGSGEEAH